MYSSLQFHLPPQTNRLKFYIPLLTSFLLLFSGGLFAGSMHDAPSDNYPEKNNLKTYELPENDVTGEVYFDFSAIAGGASFPYAGNVIIGGISVGYTIDLVQAGSNTASLPIGAADGSIRFQSGPFNNTTMMPDAPTELDFQFDHLVTVEVVHATPNPTNFDAGELYEISSNGTISVSDPDADLMINSQTTNTVNFAPTQPETTNNDAEPWVITNTGLKNLNVKYLIGNGQGDLRLRLTAASVDTDCDLVADCVDLDDDNDGILDAVEICVEGGEAYFDFSTMAGGASFPFVGTVTLSGVAVGYTIDLVQPGSNTASLPIGAADGSIRFQSGPFNNTTMMPAAPTELDFQFDHLVTVEVVHATPNPTNFDAGELYEISSNGTLSLSDPDADLLVNTQTTNTINFEPTQPETTNNDAEPWVITNKGLKNLNVKYLIGNGQGDLRFRITAAAKDTDCDMIADCLDLDSDNDGIPDAIEACGDINLVLEGCRLDNNGDGIYQTDGSGASTGVLVSACATAPVNTDGDAFADYVDLDSDADGCADNVEAGTDGFGTSTDAYVAGTVDADGLLTSGISGACPVPANTDPYNDAVQTACENCGADNGSFIINN